MKWLWIYWSVGCLLTGWATASMIEKCPMDDVSPTRLGATAAVWPILVTAAFILPRNVVLPRVCGVKP